MLKDIFLSDLVKALWLHVRGWMDRRVLRQDVIVDGDSCGTVTSHVDGGP